MSLQSQADNNLDLVDRYLAVRRQSLALCAPLELEDYQVQPMIDASPPKWHLAHITWFFETFLLKPFASNYAPFDASFESLFNSYYNGVGKPFARAKRGHLSRPTLERVLAYRQYVDEQMTQLLQQDLPGDASFRVELGLNHEQQHQELILTDLKFNLGNNPLKPVYSEKSIDPCQTYAPSWVEFEGGLAEIGTDGRNDFVFDNETPRHPVFLQPFNLSTHPVSNGEFIEFIADRGYERAELWLSDGWGYLQSLRDDRWETPLYWRRDGADYYEYSLTGERRVDPFRPVCHVSAYEADAFARWKGCRLPSEFEWEHAAAGEDLSGNFVESGLFHPTGQSASDDGQARLHGIYGDVWEWTSSSYGPYPGFKPFGGQLGEYNGKFMANQLVLRGGSCASPARHLRATYRNFFYPPDRWQFSGIRLAKDADN